MRKYEWVHSSTRGCLGSFRAFRAALSARHKECQSEAGLFSCLERGWQDAVVLSLEVVVQY